jgi:anti-sigma factor RsiW
MVNRVLHPESLRIQAYFDDELDALSAADIEKHVAQCNICQPVLQDLERNRASLRRELTYWRAPTALRARVIQTLGYPNGGVKGPRLGWARWLVPAQRFWLGALSGGLTAGIAAIFAFALWAPPLNNPLIGELMNAHLRSLMPTHLIDVVSTDKHTVKPWFSGHADVSPVVADFEAQGYRLIGGRADYLDHQRAAVVIYQHGAHVINVFTWAGGQRGLPSGTTRSGYHLVFWRSGDLEYCAISDTAPDELLGLVRLLRGLSAGEARS